MTRRASPSSAPNATRQLLRRRLGAQSLSKPSFGDPADLVSWFGAVQAQDYLGALWAIGLRLTDARERDVERALAERTIVRSWPMRGTLHFLAAADARWMTELFAPKVVRAAGSRFRALGLDAPVISRARKVIVKALEGGRRLSRPEVYALLERSQIDPKGQRGLYILWRLAHDGLLCFGPRQGTQQTFVLLEEWLPGARRLPQDEALAEVARRYFTGHGPATLRDFAWWTGLNLTDARHAIDMAGAVLEKEDLGGRPHWFCHATGPSPSASPSRSASSAAAGPRGAARAHVLPAFDEFFVGYADRAAAIDPAHASRLSPFVLLGPVVVVDGKVVGTWKRRTARGKVVCTVTPLEPLGHSEGAVKRALARYGSFLELDVETHFASHG